METLPALRWPPISPLAHAIVLVALLVPTDVRGQQIAPVADLNTTGEPASSWPRSDRSAPGNQSRSGFVECMSRTYFTAWQADTGRELWVTDYTPAGTRIVSDLVPGPRGSDPTEITCLGASVVFAATDSQGIRSLWSSDGSGVTQIAFSGSTPQDPRDLAVLGSGIYFSAARQAEGRELWWTDGFSAALAADLRAGPAGSHPRFMIGVGSTLYFQAFDDTHGTELWSLAGSAAGLVADLNPGEASSSPDVFLELGGRLLFRADNGIDGTELFVHDPLSANAPSRISDLGAGSASSEARLWDHAILGTNAIFCARVAGKFRPFVTDGTMAGTVELGSIPSCRPARDFARVGARVFFRASVDEIYSTDGAQLTRVRDVGLGSVIEPFAPGVEFAGDYLFGANGALWRTSGSQSASLLGNRSNDRFVTDLTRISNGRVVFAGPHPTCGTELWISDGTGPGTMLLADIAAGSSTAPSTPSELTGTLFGPTVYFAAENTAVGREPWTLTASGPTVHDLRQGPVGSRPSEFVHGFVGGAARTFFVADDGVHGRELWAVGGSTPVKDIQPMSTGSYPHSLTICRGRLFFAASGPEGMELWVSDGTTSSTVLVKDIRPGSSPNATQGSPPVPLGSRPIELVDVAGTLYFAATSTGAGSELWRSDGSAAGTVMVDDLYPGDTGSFPTNLQRLGSRLAFAADDGASGSELYVADQGVVTRVEDLNPGQAGSHPANLTPWGDDLYFTAIGDNTGRTLWVYSAGTVARVPGVPDNADPSSLEVADTGLFFAATDAVSGRECWVYTPGSSARRVSDQIPGPASSSPMWITAADGGVYYSALGLTGAGPTGRELWFTDGQTAHLVADIRQGEAGSNPSGFSIVHGRLYFSADDGVMGRELYALPSAVAATEPIGEPSALAHAWFDATDPVMGTNVEFSVEAGSPGYDGLLFVSIPSPPFVPAPGQAQPGVFGLVYFAQSLIPVQLISSGSSVNVPVPNLPPLAGLALHAQVMWTNQQTFYPLESSNGLRLTLGSMPVAGSPLVGSPSGATPVGIALDPTRPPGRNLSLDQAKITLCVASAPSDTRAREIRVEHVIAGAEHAEFCRTGRDGGLVLAATNFGAKTSPGTKFTRGETREMLRANPSISARDPLNNWALSTRAASDQTGAGGVDGSATVTMCVDAVTTTGDPSRVGKVVIGQIHALDNEPIRLYYRKLPGHLKGSIYFAHEKSPGLGDELWIEILGSRSDSASDPRDGIRLGEIFTYTIHAEGHLLTVWIDRPGKPRHQRAFDMSGSGYQRSGANTDMYFKFGAYNQNGSGDDDDRLTGAGDDQVRVRLFEVRVDHESR